jgi:hypothetical protein
MSPGRLQIQRDPQFIGVKVEKRAALFWVWNVSWIRAAATSLISIGFLNLDDLSTKIRHEFRRIRGSDHLSALKNADAVKRAWGLGTKGWGLGFFHSRGIADRFML